MVRFIKVWSGSGTVTVGGGTEVEITAIGSMFPVNRTFSESSVSVRLIIADRAVPDPRPRLDGGVVHGGGLMVTASAPLAEPGAVPLPMTSQAAADHRPRRVRVPAALADIPVGWQVEVRPDKRLSAEGYARNE